MHHPGMELPYLRRQSLVSRRLTQGVLRQKDHQDLLRKHERLKEIECLFNVEHDPKFNYVNHRKRTPSTSIHS